MTEVFGNLSLGISGSSAGTTGAFSFYWEHPVAWSHLRKYFEKSLGEEESKKLFSILEDNAKSLEDFLDAAFLKANGGSVYGKVNFEGEVNIQGYINVPPPGTIVQWAGASTTAAPLGWLFANGQDVLIAEYPNLYNTLTSSGTVFPYGPNTSSGTRFRLPNLAGRVPVGLDAGQTEFDTMGETGGAKTHTLSTSEIPSHSHTVTGFNGNPAAGTNPFGIGLLAISNTGYNYNTGNTGGGAAHNNLQPYIVLNYLIKH
jgi:microcystin-dependent protein